MQTAGYNGAHTVDMASSHLMRPEILTSLIVCVGIFSTSDGAVSMESERSVFKAINKRPVKKNIHKFKKNKKYSKIKSIFTSIGNTFAEAIVEVGMFINKIIISRRSV